MNKTIIAAAKLTSKTNQVPIRNLKLGNNKLGSITAKQLNVFIYLITIYDIFYKDFKSELLGMLLSIHQEVIRTPVCEADMVQAEYIAKQNTIVSEATKLKQDKGSAAIVRSDYRTSRGKAS